MSNEVLQIIDVLAIGRSHDDECDLWFPHDDDIATEIKVLAAKHAESPEAAARLEATMQDLQKRALETKPPAFTVVIWSPAEKLRAGHVIGYIFVQLEGYFDLVTQQDWLEAPQMMFDLLKRPKSRRRGDTIHDWGKAINLEGPAGPTFVERTVLSERGGPLMQRHIQAVFPPGSRSVVWLHAWTMAMEYAEQFTDATLSMSQSIRVGFLNE